MVETGAVGGPACGLLSEFPLFFPAPAGGAPAGAGLGPGPGGPVRAGGSFGELLALLLSPLPGSWPAEAAPPGGASPEPGSGKGRSPGPPAASVRAPVSGGREPAGGEPAEVGEREVGLRLGGNEAARRVTGEAVLTGSLIRASGGTSGEAVPMDLREGAPSSGGQASGPGVRLPERREEGALLIPPSPLAGEEGGVGQSGGNAAGRLEVGWPWEGPEESAAPGGAWAREDRAWFALPGGEEGYWAATLRNPGPAPAIFGGGMAEPPAFGAPSLPAVLERVYFAVVREAEVLPGRESAALELGLEPPHLGPLGVRLIWTQGRVDVGLEARNQAVFQILTAHLPVLQEALLQSGVPLGEVRICLDGGELRAEKAEKRGERVGGGHLRDGIRG